MTEEQTATTTPTGTTSSAVQSLSRWLEMWNGEPDLARRLCTDDFRIHFANSEPDGSNPGDDVLGADSFATYLADYHRTHPGVVFTEVAQAVDGEHGRLLWNVAVGDHRAGGVDVFDFDPDGLVRTVWSVGGTRTVSV